MTSTCIDKEKTEWEYFQWLYKMIGAVTDKNPNHTHFMLAEQLHKRIFKFTVPNDDNRAADGIFLRDQYLDVIGTWGECQRKVAPCSMLEMLIALAKRAAFEADGINAPNGTGDWFWRILSNLDLKKYTDEVYFDVEATEIINETISDVIYRRYDYNGKGGLFPLERPFEDQRRTEIWYQLAAYLMENPGIGR